METYYQCCMIVDAPYLWQTQIFCCLHTLQQVLLNSDHSGWQVGGGIQLSLQDIHSSMKISIEFIIIIDE